MAETGIHSLVTNIHQIYFVCVHQLKEMHKGLEQLKCVWWIMTKCTFTFMHLADTYPKRLTIQAIHFFFVCSFLDELSLRGIHDSKVSALLLEAGFTLPVCVEVSETLLQSIHFPFHLWSQLILAFIRVLAHIFWILKPTEKICLSDLEKTHTYNFIHICDLHAVSNLYDIINILQKIIRKTKSLGLEQHIGG